MKSRKEFVFDWNCLLETLFPDADYLEGKFEQIVKILRERPVRSATEDGGWITVVCPFCGGSSIVTNAPAVYDEIRAQDWVSLCPDCTRALAYRALKGLWYGAQAEKEETVRVR